MSVREQIFRRLQSSAQNLDRNGNVIVPDLTIEPKLYGSDNHESEEEGLLLPDNAFYVICVIAALYYGYKVYKRH